MNRGVSFAFDPDGDLLYDLNELALDFQWIQDQYLESLYEMASTYVFTADADKDTVRFIWIP